MAQTLKNDFAPYLPTVMPLLLRTASSKPEMTILDEDGEGGPAVDDAEYQTINIGGQRIGIRTAVLDEKVTSFSFDAWKACADRTLLIGTSLR